MDVNKYIESGLLELYVLGLVSDKEREEVEQAAAQSVEIREEIHALETTLEIYARSKGVSPPPGLRQQVMESIEKMQSGYSSVSSTASGSSLKSSILIGLLLAASLAALYFFFGQRDFQDRLQKISAEHNELQASYLSLKERCDTNATQLAALRDTAVRKVLMSGTDLAPHAMASVYFNEVDKLAFLDVIDMPAPPAGKQYQLWAIVDGKPVDMGVFDINITKNILQSVPFISQPQAFAVTLENAGGSPSPTLDQMYVIGNVG